MENKKPENANTLDLLLEVEAKASGLVKDAQEEADKRIRESEEQNRLAYENQCKKEIQAQEDSLKENLEKIKNDYEDRLNSYRKELSEIKADKDRFSALINRYIDEGEGALR